MTWWWEHQSRIGQTSGDSSKALVSLLFAKSDHLLWFPSLGSWLIHVRMAAPIPMPTQLNFSQLMDQALHPTIYSCPLSCLPAKFTLSKQKHSAPGQWLCLKGLSSKRGALGRLERFSCSWGPEFRRAAHSLTNLFTTSRRHLDFLAGFFWCNLRPWIVWNQTACTRNESIPMLGASRVEVSA